MAHALLFVAALLLACPCHLAGILQERADIVTKLADDDSVSLIQTSVGRVPKRTPLQQSTSHDSETTWAVVAGLVALAAYLVFMRCGLGRLLYNGCFDSTKPGQTRVEGPSCLAMQFSSLLWKNIVVNTRTNLPLCAKCCSGCSLQMCCPIWTIFVYTLMPLMIMHMLGADRDLQVDFGMDYAHDYRDPALKPQPSMSDILFSEPMVPNSQALWHPAGALPQGACFCRTLGIIGPSAADFQAFANLSYDTWTRQRQGVIAGNPAMDFLGRTACPAQTSATLFRVFDRQEDMDELLGRLDYASVPPQRSLQGPDRLCGAIVFENDPLTSSVPKFVVRTNVTGQDGSGSVAGRRMNYGLEGIDWAPVNWYLQSGFLSIQDLVQRYLSERRAGNVTLPQPSFVPLPMPPHHEDAIKTRLSAMVMDQGTASMTFQVTLMLVVYLLIRERNQKQKEFMRLMGLRESALVLSWLALFALMNFICSLACAIMVYGWICEKSDFLVVFLIFFLDSLATIAMGMAISSLFTTERLGSIFAFLFINLVGLISNTSTEAEGGGYAFSEHPSDSIPAMPYFICLFPNLAYVLCFRTLFSFDRNTSSGATLRELGRVRQGFSVAGGLAMLFFDIFFWSLLHLYLEEVVPHEVGAARPWYFPLTPSFWRECLCRGSPQLEEQVLLEGGEDHTEQPEFFESEETAQLQQLRQSNLALVVHGLRKSFTTPDGSRIDAVSGLTLTMYKGECFCLLGHNGAGKTTAMACITGMQSPTAGSIQIKGFRMPEDKVQVRSDMGFCMQQNILWEELTVREHILLFGALRGLTPSATSASADTLLSRVELLHKQHTRADALSGGMKRKLNVACALLGSAGVILLDEPTAGMDPHTRRMLWATLKQERQQCIMCLTTHYMDEADELGDRICIMVHGKAACCGTNSFLKQRLGCGYVLSFVKKSEEDPNEPIRGAVVSHCGPDVRKVSSAGRELRLRVPFAAASTFPKMMRDLDARLDALGLESYGVGVSDLEDVFLHVASGGKAQEALPESQQSLRQRLEGGDAALKGWRDEPSMWVQLAGLFMRRLNYGRRDARTFCCQLIVPALLMVACLGHLKLTTHVGAGFARVELDVQRPASVTVGVNGSESPIVQAWEAGNIPGVGEVRFDRGPFTLLSVVPEGPYRERFVEELVFSTRATTSAFSRSGNASKLPEIGGVLYSQGIATLFPNTQATWTAPALLNLHFAAAMRAAAGSSVPDHIETKSEPLPRGRLEQSFADGVADVAMALMVLMALSFVPTGVATYVVMEKEVGVKHQLIVSGTSTFAYWLSNLLFDSIFGIFNFLATLIILTCFQADAWCSQPNINATATLLALYIPAACAFAYFFSHFFESSGTAIVGVLMVGLVVGTIGVELSLFLKALPKTRATGEKILWVVRAVIPSACVGQGLMNLAMNKKVSDAFHLSPFSGKIFGTEYCVPVLDGPCLVNAGDDIVMLVASTVLYTIAFVLLEVNGGNLWTMRSSVEGLVPWELRRKEDENVQAERRRVSSLDPSTQVLMVDDVCKVYQRQDRRPVHAVRGISFAVEPCNIFGLLGTNGAGKTTTFKMICGELAPTAGRIFVAGKNVQHELGEVRKHIGYCPQFDALLGLMTVQEHLELFAAVKGLSGDAAQTECAEKLETLGLTEYKDSRAGQLSGGNKRKLSTAMALIREPEVIFLDEPSAGMDPMARRQMWEVIQASAASRRSSAVILTTHSMEEADALCTRIGIQCSGQLRCLGTPQQLKALYGTGLELNLRLELPTREESLALCAEWREEPAASCDLEKAKELVAQYFSGPERSTPTTEWSAEMTVGLAVAEWCLQEERAAALAAFLKETCGCENVTCVEAAGGSLRYKLSGSSPGGGPLPYSELFASLQAHQQRLHLADFQLSQGTLESTFNRLAAEDMAYNQDEEG